MKIEPTRDHIIVRPDKPKERTEGGIIIPEKARMGPTIGRVIAAGEGERLDSGALRPLRAKVGDRVLFQDHGIKVMVDGEEALLIGDYDILGIIHDGP